MTNGIAITGASGFVGKNLSSYLDRHDIEVQAISRAKLASMNHLELNSYSVIIHLAGKAHDLKKTSSPEEYYQINFEITKKLYDAFLKSSSSRFIFISSVKAVTDHLQEPLSEEVVPNPQTHYGKSKLLAENYIQAQPLPKGKLFYILRPCMIHGPGNKGNLNLLYKFVSIGIPYPFASFTNRRSFLSVENLCFVIKEILERDDIPSGAYNIADDESLSTNEVVCLLAQAQNRSSSLVNIPKSLIKFGAKLGDKLHLPLTTERLQKLTEDFVVSNQKLKQALKKELPVSAREGIIRTASSFKKL